jgi:hypothetical protein
MTHGGKVKLMYELARLHWAYDCLPCGRHNLQDYGASIHKISCKIIPKQAMKI